MPVNLTPEWKTAYFRAKRYRYICTKGEPLEIDHVGPIPKKLLKRLERIWKDINLHGK